MPRLHALCMQLMGPQAGMEMNDSLTLGFRSFLPWKFIYSNKPNTAAAASTTKN